MKTFFCLAMSVFFCVSATLGQKLSFGINAGPVLSFMETSYQGRPEIVDKLKVGMTAGLVTQIPVTKNILFLPSISFIQKGGSYRFNYNASTYQGTRTLNYGELLLNLMYSSVFAEGKIFAGLGPGVSIGIGGKHNDKSRIGNQLSDEKTPVKFGNESTDDYKPIDAGANVMAGYEFSSGVFFSVNYYQGLSNLVTVDPSRNSIKNRCIALRIGYFLPGKIKK